MITMLPLIIFYFSFFIFSQSIEFNTTCDNNRVYDSLKYECESCNGRKGLGVCYNSGISIFNFSRKNIQSCSNGIYTEVDGDGNILEEITCATKEFDYTDVHSRYKSNIGSSDTITLTINIEQGSNPIVLNLNEYNLNYYRLSCLNGKYEKSCDFLANLYTLSMYSDNTYYNIIYELDGILNQEHLL